VVGGSVEPEGAGCSVKGASGEYRRMWMADGVIQDVWREGRDNHVWRVSHRNGNGSGAVEMTSHAIAVVLVSKPRISGQAHMMIGFGF